MRPYRTVDDKIDGVVMVLVEKRTADGGEVTRVRKDGRKILVDARMILVNLADGRRLVIESIREKAKAAQRVVRRNRRNKA